MLSGNLLLIIQLSTIGVILVIGLYLIWLSIQRLHTGVSILNNRTESLLLAVNSLISQEQYAPSPNFSNVIHDMERLFGDEALYDEEKDEQQKTGVEVIDLTQEESIHVPDNVHPEVHPDVHEVPKAVTPPSETSDTHFSKTKLSKMSVEALHTLAEQRGLSTEGPKAVLVNRILESSQ